MAVISAKMVKELRELTNAGMMDCKKALTATDGDMDAAVEYLRKSGLALAAKKAGRIAAEGLVAFKISEDNKKAAIVEVNSETDFVAKNEMFQSFVASVAAQALATNAADMDAFKAEAWIEDPSMTVADALVVLLDKYTFTQLIQLDSWVLARIFQASWKDLCRLSHANCAEADSNMGTLYTA